VGFGNQVKEMESLTCKWWLETGFCKQVLWVRGEADDVVLLWTSTYLVLDGSVV